jgi:hypothetical protein
MNTSDIFEALYERVKEGLSISGLQNGSYVGGNSGVPAE